MSLEVARLHPFSPATSPPEALREAFVVRRPELAELLEQVRHAAAGAPQHLLILGRQGMGKTTLLRRLELAVGDDDELASTWLPLRFDETLYHLGGLADLWLEALDVLSLTTGDPEPAELARTLPRRYPPEALEEAARAAVREAAERRRRRLLLLVDRLDLVLGRIDDDVEASRLREVLQHDAWLMLVGASVGSIRATYDYEQPFYDLFRVILLEPLTPAQSATLLGHLAGQAGVERAVALASQDDPRFRLLHQLAGGSPRAVTQLFEVLFETDGGRLSTCLDGLLDRQAPRHRERMEQLPRQAQRVFDALARHWDPATAEDVAQRLRLERGTVSGQLHRLAGRGLVEKTDVPGRALGFQVRDRQLALWYLSAHRRGRARLLGALELAEALLAMGDRPSHAERGGGSTPSGPAELLEQVRRALDAGRVEPPEAAWKLAEVAERGGEELALQARALAGLPLERQPESVEVHLALARIEARLARSDAALDHLNEGLARLTAQHDVREVITTVAAIVAAGLAAGAAEVVGDDASDLRLIPLAHALAIAGQTDSDRMRRLSPEMRAVVELALGRLEG